MTGQRPAPTLRRRLILGNTVLILTALATTWAVETVTGPPLFRDHIQGGGAGLPPSYLDRAEQAFHIANLLQVLLATLIGLALTLLASFLLSRRVSTHVGEMTLLAAGIAAGDYNIRLPQRRTSRELDALATTINDMAGQLRHTESTRRRLLTDLSHELRTPIATVDGYLEAIEDGVEQADPDTIALLRSQLRRLTRLANDLQAISAADENRLLMEPHPTAVDDLLSGAALAVEPGFAAKGVALVLGAGNQLTALVDPDRMEQVITNLLTNALRHTPADGQVTLAAGSTERAVRIQVIDTGEGIDPAHLPYLFERFYRGHPRQDDQGSGVGLTISRAIVAAHGGTIAIHSDGVGRGTTVTITLPIVER